MSYFPEDYLGHILLETSFILDASKDIDKETFLQNPVLTRAIIRSLEIIGEATKRLSNDFRTKYPQISWKEMAGMRDILIHEYFGVDYNLVWDVIMDDIPTLEKEIQAILKEL
ncbi:DUF86 domain-containing protein [Cyanobacterium sp. IPPAS B-1200]|uniref:HepT-like ribonuclease domain-containing protein n=1 Tax=Cyanobacterium sp. IPPAS B-1200 TaxID=1562720 RepID=UPI000852652D|nr:DUF86 domain-containing protein [Cyanobacterium sp. IPPAS B-1200]OEJ77433.1 hypothetical protein A5482_05925 [Cyanobacterium sp. IPPAS B-1200]